MSEYFYFKGVIRPLSSEFESVYNELANTEYIRGDSDLLRKEGDSIVVDTVGVFASAPLSLLEEFKNKLREIQRKIQNESVIEHYSETGFGNSYIHLHLVPNATELKEDKISEADPYSKKVSSIELLESLKKEYPEAESVLKKYHEIIIEKLLSGYEVSTDLGVLSLESIERPGREMRNPQTGEVIMSKPKVAKNLKLSNAKSEWVTKMLHSSE